MATGWYYAAFGEKKLGPFSPTQLQDLAAAGTILPIDTVWQEGNEKGVLASRVQHLFARAAITTLPAPVTAPPPAVAAESSAVLVPDQPAAPQAQPKAPEKPAVKKGRAMAMSGCDIVGQDGAYARYRKKCKKCGHQDAACHMIQITNKSFKTNYFCPKCRKSCEVSIQCHL
jgi:hypothetical protein